MAAGLMRLFDQHKDIRVVGHASGVFDIRTSLSVLRPSAIVLDPFSRDVPRRKKGSELLRKCRQWSPNTAIIFYTLRSAGHRDQAYVNLGRSGLVFRDDDPDRLVQVIRSVTGGKEQAVLEMPEAFTDLRNRRGEPLAEPSDVLTESELILFRWTGRGLTLGGVSAQTGLSQKTLQSYRNAAMERLGLDGACDFYRVASLWVREREIL
jgi:DNA-binding NarL/FixJ family response regulator